MSSRGSYHNKKRDNCEVETHVTVKKGRYQAKNKKVLAEGPSRRSALRDDEWVRDFEGAGYDKDVISETEVKVVRQAFVCAQGVLPNPRSRQRDRGGGPPAADCRCGIFFASAVHFCSFFGVGSYRGSPLRILGHLLFRSIFKFVIMADAANGASDGVEVVPHHETYGDIHPPVKAKNVEELHALQKAATSEKVVPPAQSISKSMASISDGKAVGQRPRSLLSDTDLKVAHVLYNLSPGELYEEAIKYEQGSHITSTGALATLSGAKTGRSPKDKRVVKEDETQADIWWGEGSPNIEMDEATFLVNRERAVDYLNSLDKVYVNDQFLNWDPQNRIKVRIITARPYHSLFMHNMCIRPSPEELEDFEPEFTIYNAGRFPCNRFTHYMTSSTTIDIHLKRREMVILGSQYAGEMKKGLFGLMNYLMPKRGILSLHSGCNMSKDGQVSLFFGLSGTGKTTLSADPNRYLIGDDEHCWSDNGVSNIEGGCYAKCIDLSKEKEPEIWNAIRFGTVLENVVFDEHTRVVDFTDKSVTENTRASYPIEHIDNARIPCVGPHASNVILLTCDAFGVLPPVSKLTLAQTMYHFMSGYTALVAGTEVGVKEPKATFSACFGAAFIVWHPAKYASMLAEKMQKHGATAWLVNTGWVAGSYGTGYRMKLPHTRKIIDAIHDGSLLQAKYASTDVFSLAVPDHVEGVPDEVLMPQNMWPDKELFDTTLKKVGGLFKANFKKFEDYTVGGDKKLTEEILAAGPQL
ncbi:hypothetical protein CBR_g45222 [Chara braunii]|uniref:phosphoenolpyruvate carboxykinase (ATP) n=1 Tax=Chara braunii TaxID=69332 RepID=A0A388K3C3_CHABU|nr:hypothetical protein CBR_g45222 [Chara braunii]|eukprot:GBG64526.1 hypothetical protein CBR_g45222 [Chara braunii]